MVVSLKFLLSGYNKSINSMIDPLNFSIPQSQPVVAQPILPTRRLLQPSPDHADDYILELDYSSISKFLECPRAYSNYAINSREAQRDNAATLFGKLFHSCEELRLRHGWSDATRVAQHELVAKHFLHHPAALGDHRTADRMVGILGKYNDLYTGDGWPQRAVSVDGEPMVERPFKVPLCTIPVNGALPYPAGQLIVPPTSVAWLKQEPLAWEPDEHKYGFNVANLHILLTGRIDFVLTDGSFTFVVDHKTSSRGGREFEEAFYLSLQTRGYCWAAKQLGIPVNGLIMNAVVIRPPTKTGTATEFNRHTYFYSEDSLQEYEEEIKDICADLVHNLIRGRWPQTARSFKSPCSGCDYQDNCRLPRHQRGPDLSSDLFRDVTWSPINE